MQARTMILAVLVGGPLAGVLLGAAADPTMVAPPQPHWRQAQPDRIFSRSQQFVDAGPQDLSPRWDSERVPTWKRREAERRIAAATALQNAAHREDFPEPYFTGDEEAPAAGAADPARDAQTAIPIAIPAAAEPEADIAPAGG